MKSIRISVFETNSSSVHSLNITCRPGKEFLKIKGENLPIGCMNEPLKFDILSYPIINVGKINTEVEKLRIVIALLTELIYQEYEQKCLIAFEKETGKLSDTEYISCFLPFFEVKVKGQEARKYISNHKYWRYLNEVLYKRKNIQISLYDTINYFPYISEKVDASLGYSFEGHCARALKIKEDMSKEEIQKRLEQIIFDKRVYIVQEENYC